MTNVPRNVLKPPPQNRGGSNKSLMLVTPDPFLPRVAVMVGKGSGYARLIWSAVLLIKKKKKKSIIQYNAPIKCLYIAL